MAGLSLEAACEILVCAAVTARSSGDPISKIAAEAIDVVLAEVAQRQPSSALERCTRCGKTAMLARHEGGDAPWLCGSCERGGAYPFPVHPSTARGAEFKVPVADPGPDYGTGGGDQW